ncbi:MAG: gliding motility-associated C-terminal domain-containing protein [Bacteroidetes bacterium]|nr:gliding motility-associated C-terminal domain-containing protein [Bacteroidota bacterium]
MLPFTANATHIVGGEIGYRCLGGNQYEITLRVFRDCFNADPTALFDDPGVIGVYASNGLRLSNISLRPIGNDTLREGLDSCYTSFINSVCVHTTVYRTVITLNPRVGGYHFVYQRCCRNTTISNIVNPTEAGATYDILLTEAAMQKCNSSPVVNRWPPVYVCANQELNVNSSATDVNNDSIAYKLCAPLVGGTLQRPQPIPPTAPPFQPIIWLGPTYSLANVLGGNNPLTIDVNTGIMKGVPPVLGQFVVAVCLEEYDRSSKNLLSVVRRDFQYNVVNCTVPQATFEAPTEVCVGSSFTLKQSTLGVKLVEWYLGEPGAEKLVAKGDSVKLTFPSAGKNRITLYYEKGTACQSTFSAVINAVAIDVISLPSTGQNSVVCRGSNFEVKIQNKEVNKPLTYDWQTNGKLISGQGSSLATFKMDAPTLITLNLSNALGCKSTLIFPVAIHEPIKSGLENERLFCRDVATQTNPGFNSALSYQWSPASGLSNTAIGNPIVTISNNIIYQVKISNPATGCDTTVSYNAKLRAFPAKTGVENSVFICANIAQEVNKSFNPSLTYQWTPTVGLSNPNIGNPKITTSENRVYQVKVTEPVTGCDTTIFVNAIVKPFGAETGIDSLSTVCYNVGKQINPKFNNTLIYSWSPATGLSETTKGNPTVKLKESMSYSVKIQNPASGCDTTISVRIEVSPMLPVVELDTTLDFCPGIPKKVNLPESPLVTYLWSPVTGLDNANVANPTFTLNTNQLYTVKITDPKTNCNLAWKVNARVSPDAVISAGRDTTVCNYGPYTLTAKSSLPLSFQWSRVSDFSNNLGNQATLKRDTLSRAENTFYFKATDAKGCFWRDTVVISAFPVEASMPDNYVVCKPIDLTTVTIKDNDPNQGLKNYSWFPVNSLTTKPNEGPNAIYKINATSLVNVNFENKYGCKKTLETQLELIDLKVNIATDKETLIKGNNEIANISVTGCTDCAYAWTPATGLNATNIASVRATPQDTTIYKVVVSKKGCKEEKTIRINVDNVNCGEPNIFVPNAFTPNNDGNNDILKVRGRWISKLQFVVYNRWGQEMFTTTDLNNGWNGIYKGNEVAPDVYNYFLQVTCLDNKIFTKRGNTSLIK